MSTVAIRGGGLAARCCAHLLVQGGLRSLAEQEERPKIPALMLSESTQKLLADVFERRDLFDGLDRIRKRVVAWGNRKPAAFPHSAVVVSEEMLMNRIRPELAGASFDDGARTEWIVITSANPALSVEHHFGSRMAMASPIQLKAGADPHACWIESLPEGWLFLIPVDAVSAWLLAVGGASESLLAQSRVIADQIADVGAPRGQFPSHPRAADPLAGPGWLSCGSAALGFDPLCGEGAGNAVREAILASAVIRAACNGDDVPAVTAHYRARLLSGFRRHLELCGAFYESANSGPWWDRQLQDIQRGLDWTAEQLRSMPESRHRLNGFSLEAIR